MMSQRIRISFGIGILFCLVLVANIAVLAAKGGEGVEVKARVAGQILLSIESGDRISFEVDPLHDHRYFRQVRHQQLRPDRKREVLHTLYGPR